MIKTNLFGNYQNEKNVSMIVFNWNMMKKNNNINSKIGQFVFKDPVDYIHLLCTKDQFFGNILKKLILKC